PSVSTVCHSASALFLPAPPPFSFPAPAPTAIYTLSLHDALPISQLRRADADPEHRPARAGRADADGDHGPGYLLDRRPRRRGQQDRKSTRLNSSHQIISYAVFCLKKKKTLRETARQLPRYNNHYS